MIEEFGGQKKGFFANQKKNHEIQKNLENVYLA